MESDTTLEVSRYLYKCHKKYISPSTIKIIVRKAGMMSAKKVKKPFLSSKHRKERYEFPKKYKNWTIGDWKHVVWSDETKINRFSSDGTKWCWKSKKEMIKSRNVDATLKFRGGSIMIWRCMTQYGPGLITRIDGSLNGELYCDILSDELIKTLNFMKFLLKKNFFNTIMIQNTDQK